MADGTGINRRIAVIGTGANGSCVSADLVNNGYDVTMIDQWPAHVEVMRANGLHISLADEELHVRVKAFHLCDVATFHEKFDIVFLAMKAYDARWPAELMKPWLKEDGVFVALQNAMTAESVAEIIGPERTLGCAVELSSEIFNPGIVRRNTSRQKTWFGLGSLTPATRDREAEIQAILSHVGRCDLQEDVLSAKWMKLIVNTICLAPFAIVGTKMSEAPKLPGMRELMIKLGGEALAVGQKLGYEPEPIFGLTPEEIKGTNQLVEKIYEKLSADIGTRSLRNCSLQDLMKGRKSEVDLINGLVAEEGRRFGLDTPANRVVVELTHEIEAGRLKPDPANMALLIERLAAAEPA